MDSVDIQLVTPSGELVAKLTLPERPDLPPMPRIVTFRGRQFMRCDQSLQFVEVLNQA